MLPIPPWFWLVATILLNGVDAYWRMPCGVIQTGRLDPIINPGAISSHVHKISGPPNINLSSSYDTLQHNGCTSCNIQADKSAYWTPLLYYKHKNGSFEEVPADGMVVYYLGRGDNASNIIPFPPGFRMLAGSAANRAYNSASLTYGGKNGVIYTGGTCRNANKTCVGGKFVNATGTSADPPGPKFTGRPISDVTSFNCIDTAGPFVETPNITRTGCSGGLRAQIQFPSCWDGHTLYAPDQSHVAHMSQIDNGVCPPTHPYQFTHLFYEVLYSVTSITQDGEFVFANGDPTGFGFHGDFLNGWDMSVQQDAINRCVNVDNGGDISQCPAFNASIDYNSGTNCPERPPLINEPARGMLAKLPGCINITPGPAAATSADASCPPGSTPPSINNNAIANYSAPPVMQKIGSKVGGYQFTGCVTDDTSHAFSKTSLQLPNMTNVQCQSFCARKGMPLAGTEYGTQCFCGYNLQPKINNVTTYCNSMICAGNRSEYCGGPSILTIWTSTTYAGSYNPVLPAVDATIPNSSITYLGCASEPSSSRALTAASTSGSNMTNDVCAAFCAAKKLPLFGTEYSAECYCGSSLASGSSLGQAGCVMGCAGQQPAPPSAFAPYANTCGGANRLTVWNNTAIRPAGNVARVAGTAYTYQGCYTDLVSRNRRVLTRSSYAGRSGLTAEKCVAFCRSQGQSWAGLEFGSECYCGPRVENGGALAADQASCNVPCAGNALELCGGSARLSAYAAV